MVAGVTALSGCQKNESPNQRPNTQSKEIKRLELRLTKIEGQVDDLERKLPIHGERDIKTPAGPIKSVTFRIGTEDDRLRIYWADGRNSDLPCLKEQSIWACG